MKKKNSARKILILIFLVLGLLLLINNHFYAQELGLVIRFQKYAIILLLIGLLGFIFILIKQIRNKILSIIVMFSLAVSILISSSISYSIYKANQYFNNYSEYNELANCDEMEIRFNSDIENKDLKYFSYGIGMDQREAKIL